MRLVNVEETEPCVYEYSVTSPFYDHVAVAVPPPANPDGEAIPADKTTYSADYKEKKAASAVAGEKARGPEGFYRDHKGKCMKKLKKKDAAKKSSKKSSKKLQVGRPDLEFLVSLPFGKYDNSFPPPSVMICTNFNIAILISHCTSM